MNEPQDEDVRSIEPPAPANRSPEISGSPPRMIKVGVAYSFAPQASDPDEDPLAFSISNKPGWLAFDANTGQLTGVPSLGNEGTYAGIEIAVSDGEATAMLPAFTITVEPNTAPNMPPEISGTPASSVAVGENYRFLPSASDPDGDALTFSVTALPRWASFNPSTGRLSGIPQAGDVGSYTNIAISVADNSTSASLPAFSIEVVAANQPPEISGTPATSVSVNQTYSFTPAASDPNGDVLTFSIQNQPAWAQFDTDNGTLSGTPGTTDSGDYDDIVIAVSDGTETASLPTFTITVLPVASGSTTLNWTPQMFNTDGSPLSDLAGFRIYYGTSTGVYPNLIEIGNPGITSYVVDNLAAGQWFFVMTSYNSSGVESDFSNEAVKTIN